MQKQITQVNCIHDTTLQPIIISRSVKHIRNLAAVKNIDFTKQLHFVLMTLSFTCVQNMANWVEETKCHLLPMDLD